MLKKTNHWQWGLVLNRFFICQKKYSTEENFLNVKTSDNVGYDKTLINDLIIMTNSISLFPLISLRQVSQGSEGIRQLAVKLFL